MRWTVAVVVVLMAAVGCDDSSTTAPSPPPIQGHWMGTYTVSTCTGGVDFRACARLPRLANFSLDVPQGGSTWNGLLTIDVPSPSVMSTGEFRPNVPLQVSGTQSASGEIEFKTAAPLGQSACGPETVAVDWRSTVSNQTMTGNVTIVTTGHYPSVCSAQTFTVVDSSFPVSY